MALSKQDRRLRIKRRIRKKLAGTAERPRLTVFRSNRQIYTQLIDDERGVTLASASSQAQAIAEQKGSKVDQARLVGQLSAQVALEKGITEVVFDRNGYLYHGRVKTLAEAAREGGLKF